MNLRKTAVVLNGFIHDLATGYWLSSLIVIMFLHNFQEKYTAVADIINIIERFFFWNILGTTVVIFATGGIRTFTYLDNFYGADIEKTRRKMLVIKHILLLIIFGISGYFAYRMTFH
ncbi:Uncharacterised protein [uncultured archaeon]|nr:Uncharacterised protein [uncultured archaeon]